MQLKSGFPNSALAFNWFGQPTEEKDPVEPFTLYGSIFKKYLIEDLVEGKIVGRRKGFTASAWYGSSPFLSRNLL
jgi:hypothetical protein